MLRLEEEAWGVMGKSKEIALLVIFISFVTQFSFANDLKIDSEKIKSKSVRYTQYTDLSNFPIPVVFFKRGGLASGIEELNEIMQKIVYPIINESADPISAMIIEYYPNSPGNIGVEIYWTNGGMRGALIDKSADGHYGTEAYKVFFKKPTP